VHPSKDGEASSLIGRVRLHLGHREGRLVNRLDRETTGVVLVAKSAVVARELGQLLAAGAVAKEYCAIVHGALLEPRTIDAPLGKDVASPVAIKDTVRPDGARAVTSVRPVRVMTTSAGVFTVVDVVPETGRKHQIRIHLAHAGHPVVGDKLYGPDEHIYLRFVVGEMTPDDRVRLVVEYHALHAARLRWHWRGREWRFEAPRPASFAAFEEPPG
jgi:23S rRNA pseudouridine1911/1915/1917 synthase